MSVSAKILVADDDARVRESTTRILRREGFECDGVADAATAKEVLAASQYDLLIADIKMPGNAQLELIRELQETCVGLPVILMTGHPSIETAVESVELPVVAYLTKPVKPAELLVHVREATRRARVYRTLRSSQDRLQQLDAELAALEPGLRPDHAPGGLIDGLLECTLRNLLGAVSDVKRLTDTLVPSGLASETNRPEHSPVQFDQLLRRSGQDHRRSRKHQRRIQVAADCRAPAQTGATSRTSGPMSVANTKNQREIEEPPPISLAQCAQKIT